MKTYTKPFILIIITSLLCSFHAKADDQLKTGRDAIKSGDYAKAIEALVDATKSNKKNAEGFTLLGEAYLMIDSVDLALGALVQAKDIDPANARIYDLIGDTYWKQKIYAAAEEQYRKSTEIDSMSVKVYLKLADASKKMRHYNDAARAMQRVLVLDAVNLPALRGLADLFVRGKQYAPALPVLELLVRLQPDSMTSTIQYIKALSETKGDSILIPLAKKVLEKDPSQEEVKNILATAYERTKDFERGAELLDKMNPDSLKTEALISGAKTYKELEMWDKAINFYLRAMKKDSARCDVPYDLGTTYMKMKRYEEAITMFERKILCDTTPGYLYAAHLNAGMCLMQLKLFKQAKVHIQAAIQLRPDNVQAWMTLAQCLGQMDQTSEEIAAYKKIIEIVNAAKENGDEGKPTPQPGEAYKMVGVRLLIEATKDKEEPKKEKYLAALEYLKKALLYLPRECSLLLWTAQASQNSNNKEDAIKYYRKLLELCPKSKEADDAKKGLNALGVE